MADCVQGLNATWCPRYSHDRHLAHVHRYGEPEPLRLALSGSLSPFAPSYSLSLVVSHAMAMTEQSSLAPLAPHYHSLLHSSPPWLATPPCSASLAGPPAASSADARHHWSRCRCKPPPSWPVAYRPLLPKLFLAVGVQACPGTPLPPLIAGGRPPRWELALPRPPLLCFSLRKKKG